MRQFKYDVVQLIQGVQDRPCLWDKTIENYKDRVERRAAWEEIFGILDDKYDEMTPEERRIMGELVINKWTNVRDTFVKTLKNKMGKPKKRYLLHDHLKFLIKVIPEDECNADFVADADVPVTYMKEEDTGEGESSSNYYFRKTKRTEYEDSPDYESNSTYGRKKSKKNDFTEEATQKSKHKKKFKENDSLNDIDFVEVNEANDPRVMNEDEAFFASLLPTVVKYNEDEKLEFRIEVLSVMKRIKDKRKWSGDDCKDLL